MFCCKQKTRLARGSPYCEKLQKRGEGFSAAIERLKKQEKIEMLLEKIFKPLVALGSAASKTSVGAGKIVRRMTA